MSVIRTFGSFETIQGQNTDRTFEQSKFFKTNNLNSNFPRLRYFFEIAVNKKYENLRKKLKESGDNIITVGLLALSLCLYHNNI